MGQHEEVRFSLYLFFILVHMLLGCSFLAKRGVKEEIQTFDARKINPEIRDGVEKLLSKNGSSFDAKVLKVFVSLCIVLCELLSQNAKRASQAAAPLAAWVKANVKFSYVLERIEPLESEQLKLQK
jgi:dynein heavy chain 2